jgi:hypothetical protein
MKNNMEISDISKELLGSQFYYKFKDLVKINDLNDQEIRLLGLDLIQIVTGVMSEECIRKGLEIVKIRKEAAKRKLLDKNAEMC